MHGRLKVKTTAEQAEAKRLERLKKLKIYQSVTDKIFKKRAQDCYDREALELSGKVLANNPDFYTLWNYRREILNHFQETLPEEEISVLYKNELTFLEECLMVNPKSYGSWHHRCYAMLHMPSPDWSRELSLCTRFLVYDERNFHCWDYRRFVVKHSGVKPEQELEFTSDKIANNFSNYSSWHQRSKLLPQIFPADTAHSSGLQQQTLLNEMELVQNAFFTDPSDQSAWFYHRWLLGRAENELTLLDISENAGRLALTFSHPVKVLSDDKGQGQTWLNPIGTKYCHTWYTRETAVNDVTVDHGGLSHVFSLSDHVTDGSTNVRGSYFRHEMTAATSDVLSQELESCQQLFELEPDNKWVLLTIVLLMKSLDAAAYKEQIMSNLDKLSQVDSYRKYYYLDLRTKFLWEESIMSLGLATELSLRSCAVTKLNYAQLLCGLTHLDLSHNHLRSVSGVYCMQRLKELDVSNNMITSASPIQHMACLEIVNLENNAIKDPECEEKMKRTCQALRLVVLDGNPLDSS